VRELRNLIERAINIAEGDEITVADLPKEFYQRGSKIDPVGYLPEARKEAEKRLIVEALRSANGNKVRAAKMLGIHRTGLYQKIKRYGLNA
jgi:DNA-binding NtrC family response regulator